MNVECAIATQVLLRTQGYPMKTHVIRFIFKRESSIQYGYRKCETHARVFSRTLGHENSKIEKYDKEAEEEG